MSALPLSLLLLVAVFFSGKKTHMRNIGDPIHSANPLLPARSLALSTQRGEFACCGVATHRPLLLIFLLWKREGVGSGCPIPAIVESARRRTPALFPGRILKVCHHHTHGGGTGNKLAAADIF